MPRRNVNLRSAPAAVADLVDQLGRRIATARTRRGLRQQDLAAKAGISKVTLNRVEHGALGTGIGAYVAALWAMGLEADLGLTAHPDRDEEGKTIEAASQPNRVRPRRDLSSAF